MNRRQFMSTAAAALATPTALLLGEREAAAEAQAESWLRGDAEWLHNREAAAVEEDCSWRLPDQECREPWGLVVREYPPMWQLITAGDRTAHWAGPEYDKASEHLADLINDVRTPNCELDPVLMAGSLHWAKTMAIRGWQGGGRRRRRRRRRRGGGPNHDPNTGAAEIVAYTGGSYTQAVGKWTRSRPHNAIMYGRRYHKIGVGVARSTSGAYFVVARFA